MQGIEEDTIAAIATPPGKGGVAIVRVSGPATSCIAQKILKKSLTPRVAQVCPFYDVGHEIIDVGLALFFKNPHSFTGEDVLELHGHGGTVVMSWLLDTIIAYGARVAQPGEFTQRAFLNDKIDLTQAEAVADLIDASTKQAALNASRSLQGIFSQRIHGLAEHMLKCRVYVEAAIDFPDEEVDFLSDHELQKQLDEICDQISLLLQQAQQGQLLKEGMRVAIIGQPNAGKSSLLNALTLQESAIVTPIAGTTRDLVKETIEIDGMPVHLVDTAGIRDGADIIEQEGIKRAKAQLEIVDRILLVIDSNSPTLSSMENEIVAQYPDKISILYNKIDLRGDTPSWTGSTLYLSAKTRQGLELLKAHLKKCMGYQSEEANGFIARKRHLQALEQAYAHCLEARHQLRKHRAGELAAQELNLAHRQLGEVVGKTTADDLLGQIFSSFCIGK